MAILIAVSAAGWWPVGLAADAPAAPTATAVPPVVFDGFGLEEFSGSGSITAALRDVADDADHAEPPLGVPFGVLVKGPSGRDRGTDPLAAELRSRIEGIDLSAGMQADPATVQEGPAKWVGGLGLSNDHDRGREALELKTSLGRSQQAGILGVELGPRIERRLRDGTLFFLDGKAQAQARRSAETGMWQLPGMQSENAAAVGVAASAGVTR
jgi:hypothetical protein